MQLWDFEAYLRDLLATLDGITSAETFRVAGIALQRGVVMTSTSGTRVLIHLTRGSGGSDEREEPPEHLARVAELEGVPAPDLKPLPDATADKVEDLLRTAIDNAPPPGMTYVMTLHDWRNQAGKTSRARGTERAQAGLVVRFQDQSETYLRIFRA
jgi:hypothetical protein